MSQPVETTTAGNLTSHGLTERILPIIEAGVDAELPEFNEIAMDEFAFQYANNQLFREFCDAKKVRPGDIDNWRDVPMVYNDVFKTHLVASFPLENAVLGCLTGGTTSLTQRGRIFRDEDGKKLVFGANKMMTGSYLFPDFDEGTKCRILILAPSPEFAPSMGMAIGMDQTRQAFGTDDSLFLLKRTGIDVQKLITALRESESSGVPVALIGATSAYRVLLPGLPAGQADVQPAAGQPRVRRRRLPRPFRCRHARRLLRDGRGDPRHSVHLLRQRPRRGGDGHQPVRRRAAPPRQGPGARASQAPRAAVVARPRDERRRPDTAAGWGDRPARALGPRQRAHRALGHHGQPRLGQRRRSLLRDRRPRQGREGQGLGAPGRGAPDHPHGRLGHLPYARVVRELLDRPEDPLREGSR